MALPKELKKALQAKLKEGESLPDEFDDCVYFPNEGAALAFAETKGKSRLKAAEDAASEAASKSKALEAQMADVLKGIGIDSPDKIDEFRTKFAEAQGSLTEVDKLKVQLKDASKNIEKLTAKNGELDGFRVRVLKDQAIDPHMAKIKPELRTIVKENILGKLALDEKGTVTAPEGKAIDAFLEEMLKATPDLKAPDFKAGPGTGPGGGKTDGDGAGNGKTPANSQNGTPLPFDQQLRADLAAAAEKVAGGAAQ